MASLVQRGACDAVLSNSFVKISHISAGPSTCEERSPGRMARCGDRTAGAKDRVECRSHGCREAHRRVSYQTEG